MTLSTPPVALPGPIRQIGFVVNDLDRALESWVALGVGPWYVVRGQQLRTLYRGEPCEVTLTIALANSGDMQFEVIAQEGGDPSIYTEFLASGREGFNQFAYWATDYETAVQSAGDAGWPVVWSGGEAEGVRYAYLEPPNGPAPIIEISELNEITNGLGDFLRAAADGWDGADPIRSFTGQ
ncbi:VOC family protein [Aldersonia sp. NBC_00410]|uniref:VOC family protein n=1 Tax=Aldersonia sp. NBC_00410 TaxID=2975954 RepID=UPI002254D14D|nr:VOC family protein [Aldersonia sp. NBC_00410]MCX5042345.1 VOC family protein [Aldersonia sp. NBC_00410]